VLLAFNKPYGVLSQFTPEPASRWDTLASFGLPPDVYPIGRLDADSEGLLLLSDEASLTARLLDPVHRHPREYWVQVERQPQAATLAALASGVVIGGVRSASCTVHELDPAPSLPGRTPPIRFRASVPTAWLSMELVEGKNRQVRRMTAAVGHPTLRLVRVRIGTWHLDFAALPAGRWLKLSSEDRRRVLATHGTSRETLI
jgi:23S rRNA pseudouridine2457 synthase